MKNPIRFSLRAILIMVAIAAILLGFIVQPALTQRAVVRELSEKNTGYFEGVYYDYNLDDTWEKTGLPKSNLGSMLARKKGLLPLDFQYSVVAVSFESMPKFENCLSLLKKLPHLRKIFIGRDHPDNAPYGSSSEMEERVQAEFPNVDFVEYTRINRVG